MKRVDFDAAERADLGSRFVMMKKSGASRQAAAMPLSGEPEPLEPLEATTADLLGTADGCGRYLDALAVTLHTSSRAITASQFAKRYAALVAVPALYAISRYDKAMCLQAAQCRLTFDAGESKGWALRVHLGDVQAFAPESDGQREAWLRSAGEGLFAGHLEPLWKVFAQASSISKAILWENTAVRVFSLYRKLLAETEDAERREQIQDDFDYWLHRAPAELFGETYNPLRRYYGEVRRTCCLYYLVSPAGEYCQACPKAGRSG